MSILKLIDSNLIIIDKIIEDTRINKSQVLSTLNYLEKNQLLVINGKNIEISNYSKILLTAKAIELGADIENTTSLLQWKEFEEIAAFTLEKNNYIVKKNFRFTYSKKRNEIDHTMVLSNPTKHNQEEFARFVSVTNPNGMVNGPLRNITDLMLNKWQEDEEVEKYVMQNAFE